MQQLVERSVAIKKKEAHFGRSSKKGFAFTLALCLSFSLFIIHPRSIFLLVFRIVRNVTPTTERIMRCRKRALVEPENAAQFFLRKLLLLARLRLRIVLHSTVISVQSHSPRLYPPTIIALDKDDFSACLCSWFSSNVPVATNR